MEKKKLIMGVSGSRLFHNYPLFCSKIDDFIKIHGAPSRLVSGGAKGADNMAERWASEHGYRIKVIPPDYDNKKMIAKYGASTWRHKAPLVRDKAIAKDCTHLIAFPIIASSALKSNGTRATIGYAEKYKRHITVHEIEECDLNYITS